MDLLHEKIGLGTVQFGVNYGISNHLGVTPPYEVKKILDFSKSIGIQYLDTAVAYGNAEKVLGSNDLKPFKIVSKFTNVDERTVEKQIHGSLKNLNIDTLYGYLSHKPQELIKNPKLWDTLIELKKNGLIQKIGFSLNEIDELDELLKMEIFPDLVQCPYNYFDNRFEERLIELKKNGCEVHTRSTFLQGLFFMNHEELGEYFDSVKTIIKKLQSKDKLSGLLLNHSLEKPFIDRVIMGVNNCIQLKDNIELLTRIKTPLRSLEVNIEDRIIKPYLWPKQ